MRNFLSQLRLLNAVRHNPLWFGCDDVQLEKAAIEMGWRELANWQVVAAIACSLVAERLTTGNPLRYSRSQRWYAYFADHIHDPLMAYRRVVPAMDLLFELGAATGEKGIHLLGGNGRQSIAEASPEMAKRLVPILDLKRRRAPKAEDVLVLRGKDKKMLPVPDTRTTRRWRADLQELNAAYATHEWFWRGHQLEIPPLRRIFNRNIRRGGRGYHHGDSYQQLSHQERAQITVDVNGVLWPTVERDHATLHIKLLYAQAGVAMPDGDAYTIDGFDRGVVKAALNTLLNARTEKQALGVIGGDLLKESWGRGRELIEALKTKHGGVVSYFCSDAGAKFQRMDSDMAMAVALAVLRRTGRPPLIIHDSFIVAVCDHDVLDEEMQRALSDALVGAAPKSSRKVSPKTHPAPSIHLGKQTADQHQLSPFCPDSWPPPKRGRRTKPNDFRGRVVSQPNLPFMGESWRTYAGLSPGQRSGPADACPLLDPDA